MQNLTLTQIIALTDQARGLHNRLDNHYDICVAAPTPGDKLDRLKVMIHRAWDRYQRRVDFESTAFKRDEFYNRFHSANEYRQLCSNSAGVVVFYNGEVQGWCNELRNPESWRPGCIAVSEDRQYVAFGGDDYNAALQWQELQYPAVIPKFPPKTPNSGEPCADSLPASPDVTPPCVPESGNEAGQGITTICTCAECEELPRLGIDDDYKQTTFIQQNQSIDWIKHAWSHALRHVWIRRLNNSVAYHA